MAAVNRKLLNEYLALRYPFEVIADPDGTYVIRFPDLPGCMTQVDCLDEIPAMAEEIRTLWIETEYDLGRDIPLPSHHEEYSGRFNVRLPRSLHRSLVEAAERDGVSLNHYVSNLLARGDARARIERELRQLAAQIGIDHKDTPLPSETPAGRRSRSAGAGQSVRSVAPRP